MANDMNYGDYLQLDQLLSCQKPLSENHNEMLFVVIHQNSELWMKLLLHELDFAIAHMAASTLGQAFKALARTGRIMEQLIHTWSVLSTLTPAEYEQFRKHLGTSSGFQSYQYRLLEFKLGNKNPHMLSHHESRPSAHADLTAALNQPSVYDHAVRLLHQAGLNIDADVLQRNVALKWQKNNSVEQAWIEVYRHNENHFELYDLAEKLVDLESSFQLWRFRHMQTVTRIIGSKTKGTGGTSGVAYLQHVINTELFPELWSARSAFG